MGIRPSNTVFCGRRGDRRATRGGACQCARDAFAVGTMGQLRSFFTLHEIGSSFSSSHCAPATRAAIQGCSGRSRTQPCDQVVGGIGLSLRRLLSSAWRAADCPGLQALERRKLHRRRRRQWDRCRHRRGERRWRWYWDLERHGQCWSCRRWSHGARRRRSGGGCERGRRLLSAGEPRRGGLTAHRAVR